MMTSYFTAPRVSGEVLGREDVLPIPFPGRPRVFPLQAVRKIYITVTPDHIRELAAGMFRPDSMATAVCGPDGLAALVP